MDVRSVRLQPDLALPLRYPGVFTGKPEHLKTFGDRLWQRYGFERTLRTEESTLSVARHVLENPVRAGLAKRVQDYPFVGSSVYTVEEILEAVQLGDRWYNRSG